MTDVRSTQGALLAVARPTSRDVRATQGALQVVTRSNAIDARLTSGCLLVLVKAVPLVPGEATAIVPLGLSVLSAVSLDLCPLVGHSNELCIIGQTNLPIEVCGLAELEDPCA